MDKEDLFITEEMLTRIAEYHPESNRYTFHYDRLKAEDTFDLLVLPGITLLRLVSIIDKDNLQNLVSKGFRADEQEDAHSLVTTLNHSLDRVAFLTEPASPPLIETTPDDLFLEVTNYVILWQALSNYLEHGDRACLVEWMESIALKDVPPTVRFPFLLAHTWVAQSIRLLDEYLTECLETIKAEDLRVEDLPYQIRMIFPDDATEGNDIPPLITMVAIHYPNQDAYRLWVRFHADEKVDFYFEPLWSDDDPDHVEKLITILVSLESSIETMVTETIKAWEHYSENLDEYAIQDPGGTVDWIKALCRCGRVVDVSYDYKTLRNSLMTLPWHIQTSGQIKEASEAYLERYRKNYIPPDLLEKLQQANTELNEILLITERVPPDKREKKAIDRIKECPESFKNVTEQQIRDAIRSYPDGRNRARDIKEFVLTRIAEQSGRNLSRTTTIRQLIKTTTSNY